MILNDIIELSRHYGSDKEYVIAGGGNTSFKNEKNIWVKASGIPLANIDEDGFVCLSRDKLKIISLRRYSSDVLKREEEVKNDLMNSVIDDTGKRPSVESSLHNSIDYPLIVHTHPTLGNSLLCSNRARELTHELFGESALYIAYIDPGYTMFKKVENDLAEYRSRKGYDPKIIMLENHGIFVNGNTSKEIKETYSHIETTIKENIVDRLPSTTIESIDADIIPALLTQYPDSNNLVAKGISSDLIQNFVKDAESFHPVSTAFTPDHIVYCKAHYLFIEEEREEKALQQLHEFKKEYGYFPKVIALKEKGLVIIDDSENAIDSIADLIINMMKISFFARSFGGSKPLSPAQISFIDNWEAEHYRKKMTM